MQSSYLKNYVKRILIKRPWLIGFKRTCNICGFSFRSFADFAGREARCYACNSLERQRHLYIHLLSESPYFKGKKILHFAPEGYILNFLTSVEGVEYVDADIENARNKIDITNIPYPDDYFDIVIAFHILEHVVDDRKAFSELHRVAKTDSKTYLCVPLKEGSTFEDKEATSPEKRLELYGMAEHVRIYGKDDFKPLFQSIGYDVVESNYRDFPRHIIEKYLLGDIIYIGCKKN